MTEPEVTPVEVEQIQVRELREAKARAWDASCVFHNAEHHTTTADIRCPDNPFREKT